jgi:nicotinate-nucleotide pyrophosphorylase (carboxylating)
MHSIDDLVKIALAEDIGSGDITTDLLVDLNAPGTGVLVAKESMVVAGLDVSESVFRHLDDDIVFNALFKDGDEAVSGDILARISGRLRTLLTGERTALNFLQHLSGIATHVRSCLKILGTGELRLVDTRKTTPGMRLLEKYAVRMGGARNHRMGLYDGVLIKDNHIAVCGSISSAVKRIRDAAHHLVKIEVEVANLSQVREAVDSGADVIMLDNMDVPMIQAALDIIDGNALVEISGGINEKNLEHLKDLGVDIVSSGALTHSARSVDISMRIEASA